MTDALAAEGLRHSARALRRAYTSGMHPDTREDLMLASLCGGLCLANGGLGAVHGFAAPLGGMVHAPHGALCAALLVPVMEVNLRALAEREPEHSARARYREIAEIVTGRHGAGADEGVAWMRDLCRDLEVRSLGQYGLSADEVPALVAKAKVASSMRGNPLQLSDQELGEVVRGAYVTCASSMEVDSYYVVARASRYACWGTPWPQFHCPARFPSFVRGKDYRADAQLVLGQWAEIFANGSLTPLRGFVFSLRPGEVLFTFPDLLAAPDGLEAGHDVVVRYAGGSGRHTGHAAILRVSAARRSRRPCSDL